MTKQSNSNEGQWQANCLNYQMESNSNNTLQPKCEKKLHVKTSRANIQKEPHILVLQNSHHWNKNTTWDLGSLSLNSHTPFEFL